MTHPRLATHAYTLIEGLIVITIIVALLALLTPALDKASGKAEMTVIELTAKAGRPRTRGELRRSGGGGRFKR